MGEFETPNNEVHEHRDSTVYKVFQEESAIRVKNVPYIKLLPYNQTSIAAV